MDKKILYNFGWGNPHFLLDILESKLPFLEYRPDLRDMIYGPYEGMQDMIEVTRKVILQTTGRHYNHILMTNGATSAINILLRYFKGNGGKNVHTTMYGYPSYEEIIKRANLKRIHNLYNMPVTFHGLNYHESILLIDSPENPTGDQFVKGDNNRDIWDGVYHNKIYLNNTRQLKLQPEHKYFVGSYSKLLGVAGMRVGFIATDDPLAYQALSLESQSELTGISRPSQELLMLIFEQLDLDDFMAQGHIDLCYNKEEFQKIEYLFDNQPVNEIGMFYCIHADDKAIKVLDKSGVEYVRLDHDTIRLSMGQNKKITQAGIKAILRGDR